jgi:drug/metabolite transporter (DMT)-like permease
MSTPESSDTISPLQGRCLILLAAVLWSLNGFFNTLLRENTFAHLNEPKVLPLHIAFFRVLFAGLMLAPSLRRKHISFKPAMLFTAACFAIMNVSFVTAMAERSVASALFLQYTAPAWMYLVCVLWWKEPTDRRSLFSVILALAGVVVIVLGGWGDNQLWVCLLAVNSGIFYAAVLLGLRVLCRENARWLTVINFLTSALVLLPLMFFIPQPTWPQLAVLFVYGVFQLGVPYYLMARGLRSVSPQEAGMLTLVEPLLSPVWVFLTSTERKVPEPTEWIGGAFILGALAWRYAPGLFRNNRVALNNEKKPGNEEPPLGKPGNDEPRTEN